MRIAWKRSVLECFFIIIKFQQKKRIRLKKDTKQMPLWNPSNIEEPFIITASFLLLIYSLTFNARKLTTSATF